MYELLILQTYLYITCQIYILSVTTVNVRTVNQIYYLEIIKPQVITYKHHEAKREERIAENQPQNCGYDHQCSYDCHGNYPCLYL